MRALQFTEKGNLASLRYTEVPEPVPATGEVLVAVRAAALNPSDVKNVLGSYGATTVPRISGRDFAGVVIEGPSEWLGKKVFGCALEACLTRDGAHAEQLAIAADALVEMPSSLSFETAAALGVPFITAWDALRRAQVTAQDKTLVLGGGAVALAARSLLRWQGSEPLMGVRNVRQRQTLEATGSACVDSGVPDALPAQVQQQFGALADFVFDTTGQLTTPAIHSLANRGRLAIIAAPRSGQVDFPLLDFYRRGLTLFGVISLLHDNRAGAELLSELLPGFASGQLQAAMPRSVPLSEGVAAYRAMDAGDATKVVLIP